MPGNYRYEEERNRGERGTMRRGFGERGRDEDEYQEQQTERFGRGPDYERDRGQGERTWGSSRRQYGYDEGFGRGYSGNRSSGGRDTFEGYDEDDNLGMQDGYRQGGRQQGGYPAQGRSRYGASQADGWNAEPDEMRWGRRQGLYGSSEYGGYLSSQRSQSDFQSHVGKGPKNWQRSDERIREEVNEALARHPEIDATDLEVKVQGGEVTLTGTVTDRRAKRTAEDVAERVFGAKEVQNQIRVKADGEGSMRDRTSDRELSRSTERESRTSTEPFSSTRTAGSGTTPGGTTR